MSSHQVS